MACRITVDVNVLSPESKDPEVETLKRWKEEGKILLIEADRPEVAKTPAYGWPGAPPKPNPASKTSWSGPKGRQGKMRESGPATFNSIAAVVYPGKDPHKLSMADINGVARLIAHHLSKNELFVTKNVKDFIDGGRREKLKSVYGIVAMVPEEAVSMLCARESWSRGDEKTARRAAKTR